MQLANSQLITYGILLKEYFCKMDFLAGEICVY